MITGHSHATYFTEIRLKLKMNSREYFSYGLILEKFWLVVFSQFFMFTSTSSQHKILKLTNSSFLFWKFIFTVTTVTLYGNYGNSTATTQFRFSVGGLFVKLIVATLVENTAGISKINNTISNYSGSESDIEG